MKLKALVMLSGFLVLTTLIVCVSVYAYNAYANASSSDGGCNGWGLWNGTFGVVVRIDGNVPEPREDHQNGRGYGDGRLLSEGVSAGNPNNESVYGEGYISGVEADGTPRHRRKFKLWL